MKKNQTAVIAALSIVLLIVVAMLIVEKGKSPSSSQNRSSGDAQTYQLISLETRHGLVFPNSSVQLPKDRMTLFTLDGTQFRFVYLPSEGDNYDRYTVMMGDVKRESADSKNATLVASEIAWSGYSAAKALAETREFFSSLSEFERDVLANDHQVKFVNDDVLGELQVRLDEHDDGTLAIEFLGSKIGNFRFPGEQMMEMEWLNRREQYVPVSPDPGDSN